ncbi:ATP-binding protein [Tenacibaculum sp. ZS6-P6]|uniref:sensor histidine kinase n=1 Tax=Tenacibaculum sp. ZS6-P6 TaxID=3447503 RepID=UPI003F9A4DEF
MKKIIFIILIKSCFVYTQSFNKLLDKLNNNDIVFIKDSSSHFSDELSSIEFNYIDFQKKLKSKGKIDTLFLKKTNNKEGELVLKNIILGDFYLNSIISQDSLSFDKYNLALNKAITLNNSVLISESVKKILFQLFKNRKNLNLLPKYLKIYRKNLLNVNDSATYNYFKIIHEFNKDSIQKSLTNFKINIKTALKTKNKILICKYYQFIGILYFRLLNKKKELENYQTALKYIENENSYIFNIEKFGLYVNIASSLYDQKKIKQALIFYDKASKIKIPSYRLIEKVKFNDLLAKNYFKIKDYKSAFTYLKKANSHKEKLNEYKKDIDLNDIDVKYKTLEKEKELIKAKQKSLISEQKRKETLGLFYGSLIFLLLGGIIAYLNLKNSRKKRLLAEQQKELEKQKNLTLLKEQEINTINAMVTGQEKERVRIAEDLHDNIGSVLATLKLHFENLKLNREKKHFNQDELYEKTEKLIDETYLKVRSIAHAKNAGVIANQGLLVAIKIMAEKISAANQLKIEIIDFGLEQRLNTNTELTLFRIIQELTTNIIKHAEASEATINISQFNDALNIIIEDNGKGFDPKKIKAKTGMGLHSIQKRIEHLEGTFQIDSSSKSGTSIIMNIPV